LPRLSFAGSAFVLPFAISLPGHQNETFIHADDAAEWRAAALRLDGVLS
jgi:hypothetical protein